MAPIRFESDLETHETLMPVTILGNGLTRRVVLRFDANVTSRQRAPSQCQDTKPTTERKCCVTAGARSAAFELMETSHVSINGLYRCQSFDTPNRYVGRRESPGSFSLACLSWDACSVAHASAALLGSHGDRFYGPSAVMRLCKINAKSERASRSGVVTERWRRAN